MKKNKTMFGAHGSSLFDDNISLMSADVWNDRSHNANSTTSRSQPSRHSSIIARTLLPHDVHNSDVEQQYKSTKKQPDQQHKNSMESNDNMYCEAYPDTNTKNVDWALFAAQRVAIVNGIELNKSAQTNAMVERNMSVIYYANYQKDRFKNDQRVEILDKITLQGILMSIFLPNQLVEYFGSIAAQHSKLKLAARQCIAQVEQNTAQLLKRSAQDRDLLIKRILFYADNGQTECSFTIDSRLEFGKNEYTWSQYTLESINEPDLFGRAIGVLVHQVLQSPSLRVKSTSSSSDKTKIVLQLSWKTALENLRIDHTANNTTQKLTEETPRQQEKKKQETTSVAVSYLSNPLFDNTTKTEYF